MEGDGKFVKVLIHSSFWLATLTEQLSFDKATSTLNVFQATHNDYYM